MNKLGIYIQILLLTLTTSLYSQNAEIDSIKQAIESMPDDSVKVDKIIDLCNQLKGISLSQALEYTDKALNISKEINCPNGVARSNMSFGYIYLELSDYDKAKKYYEAAENIYKSIDNRFGLAKVYNALGQMHYFKGDFEKALSNYFESLRIMDEVGNKQGMSELYTNIGIIYFSQMDTARAIEYFNKDLNLALELGNKSNIAISYNNLSYIYRFLENFDTAIIYINKSLELYKEESNIKGMAETYHNIGTIYQDRKEYDTALIYYFKGLQLQREIGNKKNEAATLREIGELYDKIGQYTKSIDYLKRSLETSKSIAALDEMKEAYKGLADVNAHIEKFEDAYKYQKNYNEIKDSIFKVETSQELTKLENKYEIEKKEKELELKVSELKRQEEKVQKQRILIFTFIGIFIIIILFTLMVLRLNRQIKQKNTLLADQKEEIMLQRDSLELLNNELAQQKEEVTAQRDEIEKKNQILQEANKIIDSKNKNITASIRYAQRIQHAILPSDKFIRTFLPDSFILFLPKDIVSGDFYWIDVNADKIFFSAVDCTGHGVPGAFMSILARNILTQAVNEEKIEKPSEVLNYSSMLINKILRQKSSDKSVKDGMDLGLCVINRNKMLLEFSGANNPAYIARNKEIIQLKGDKYPIGEPFTEKFKSYTNQTYQLEKGDVIYTFSDGYQDQFGGPRGKKFLTKRLRETLAEISHLPMNKQQTILQKTFEDWKGDKEQIDDVCIIGVRV